MGQYAIETVTACVDEFVGLLDRQIGQPIAGQVRDSFAGLMKAVERRGELITYYDGAHTTPDPDLTREVERAHVTALEQFQEVIAKAAPH
jgi:hypothetical protein